MTVLGISAFYHDSAAAILRDGELLAASQEERYTRIRHDAGFPLNAVRYCLNTAGIEAGQLDAVVFYDKPLLKFSRILETYLSFPGKGLASYLKSVPLWLREKLWMPELIRKQAAFEGKLLFAEHHESHAASAFFPSPFSRAAILTIDGVGEWATSSFGRGEGNRVSVDSELHFPHSIGLLYSAFTYFTGFKVNSGEYKIMGLAPYGEPRYVKAIFDHVIELRDDGSFTMNQEFFDYCTGLTMTNSRFGELFGGKPRVPETDLTQREMDLARSVQDVTEEIVLRMAAHVKKETGEENLCLAGGVALNCVANGKLLRSGIFKDVWIQPAAGDAGGAVGAAYIGYHHYFGKPSASKAGGNPQKGSYLGDSFSHDEITAFLAKHQLPYSVVEGEPLFAQTAEQLAAGKVVGWFQGRMEFGPRALGNRSIIGDARNPEMQKTMNLKIKFREGFRPFAPSVLAERVSDWFEIDRESPYMLLVADVKKEKQLAMTEEQKRYWGIEKLNVIRSSVPAVTHVDYSARLQTVSKTDNPVYHRLIECFYEKTGCPVIVNTSFNVRGEPIVRTPQDAYTCFMRTGIDILVLGNCVLYKEQQPPLKDDSDWKRAYELD